MVFRGRRETPPSAPSSLAAATTVPASRKSLEYATLYGDQNLFTYIPRQFQEYHRFSLERLQLLSSTEILRLLCYVEPNVSHAISNYLRVFDSGYFLTARKPNGSIHEQGANFLRDLMNRLNHPAGPGFSPDTSINQFALKLATHILLDGAISAELVFDENQKVVEVCSIDPATIEFKTAGNNRLIPVQGYGLAATEVPLDYPNIFYIPVDPIAGDPYGTNQIISVIQAVINKFRLLQDFARALHNLGFDRIDVQISQESILEACKARGMSDPKAIVDEIQSVVAQARRSLQSLEADDNPVHLDTVGLKALEGRNSSQGLDVQAIVNVLLSDIASGLKTYATILGKRFGGSTEGYTSVEALLFLKLIQGFQAISKRLLDRLFTLALQVEAGIQAYADWVWMEPSLRPKYEAAQYYAAYSLMLFEEEKLGTISQGERNFMIRNMLGQNGPPPPDAKREEDFRPSGNQPTPQRDVSQEAGKEKKRQEANRDRKTGGNGQESMEIVDPLAQVVNLLVEQIFKRDESFIFALSQVREDFLRITRDFSDRLARSNVVTSEEIGRLRVEIRDSVNGLNEDQRKALFGLVAQVQENYSVALGKVVDGLPKQINVVMNAIPVDLHLSQALAKRTVTFSRDETGMLNAARMEEVADGPD